MAVMSGRSGSVAGETQITSWSFSTTSNNSSWGSSSTNGYKDRVSGVLDGSGSIEGKWDGSQALVEGAEATLTLTNTDGSAYSVPSIIDTFTVDVDVDDGEVVGWSADFSTNGEWTFNGS